MRWLIQLPRQGRSVWLDDIDRQRVIRSGLARPMAVNDAHCGWATAC